MVKEFLAAGARFRDVNGREDALLHDGTIQMDLHVPGTLVFLEDQVIHATVGLDQGGGQNGETPPLLDIAGRSEETFWTSQSRGIHTTAHRSTLALDSVVIAS
jgi:hypothetical protein